MPGQAGDANQMLRQMIREELASLLAAQGGPGGVRGGAAYPGEVQAREGVVSPGMAKGGTAYPAVPGAAGTGGGAGGGLAPRAGGLRRRQVRLAQAGGGGAAAPAAGQAGGQGWSGGATGGLPDPAAQIARQLMDNLARLRSVLQESEQIANRIEQLSQQMASEEENARGASGGRQGRGGDGGSPGGDGTGEGPAQRAGSFVRAARRKLRQLT
ncbi:MAG: hypothetical protein QJR08_07735 [Bacillota bacterium]|nr:hypothetical protein [Bacillota bacterium]